MTATDWAPMPAVRRGCLTCGCTLADATASHIVVSPSGLVHIAGEWGTTGCGKDASGPGWWWPL